MDFFDEVKQEAQKDKMSYFFVQYFKTIIILISMLCVILTGYYFWDQHKENKAMETANLYNEAISSEGEKRIKLLKQINSDNIFNILAQLKLAEIFNDQNNFNEALYYFGSVFKNPKAPKQYADYAELMFIKTEILMNKNSYSQNIDLLKKYVDDNKIFKDLARLYLASLYIESNNNSEAKSQLNYILSNELNFSTNYIISLAKELKKKAQKE